MSTGASAALPCEALRSEKRTLPLWAESRYLRACIALTDNFELLLLGGAVAMRKSKQPDLEKVAGQLAKIHVLPVVDGDQITLRAAAHFTTRSFTAGEYQVSVGLNQALLHLEHPSYELEHKYHARLPKSAWSQNWTNLTSSQYGGSLVLKIGTMIGALRPSGQIAAGRDSRETTEQNAHVDYPLVTVTPTGWRIGTEMGDPRTPANTLPEGLEHCLDGEYLSGCRDEQGEGYREGNGSIALGVLKPKVGGNDPRVVATLICVSGALLVAVRPTANALASGLKEISERKRKEQELRQAFIDICLRRADEAQREHVRTDVMLSGEFYLCHHESHAPRLSSKELAGQSAESESIRND
jgi:hypothetical protein